MGGIAERLSKWVLCLLFVDCALYQHPDTCMSAILQCIAMYLKMAPYRHGGAGKGAGLLPVKNSQQLHVECDTDSVDAEFHSDGDVESVSVEESDGDRDSDNDADSDDD